MNNTERTIQSRQVASLNGGFAAGTLVHLRSGLLPIEQVRAGDWVLSGSQSQDGTARAYQQVVDVFSHPNEALIFIQYYRVSDNAIERFCVSSSDLFRTTASGWTRADRLGRGSTLELHDGASAITLCTTPIFRTVASGIGWVRGAFGVDDADGAGYMVDLASPVFPLNAEEIFNWGILDNERVDPRFKSHVFDLKMAASHTYFVGNFGALVHNDQSDGPA